MTSLWVCRIYTINGPESLNCKQFSLLIDADTSDAYCKTTRVENEPKLKWRFYHGCIDECLILKFIDTSNLTLPDGPVPLL